ncbi:MAG: response regulator [Magnetospirillum sp.]|nr:MAG: response regulator [Magnetospirillum sp.]
MANTVLIAEYDNWSSKVMADELMANGYATLRTRNGGKVVEIARRHRPCLIMMDIKLPDIAGADVARALKADPELRDIPVIAVTPCSMRGDKEVNLAAGFDGHVCQPISISSLLQAIDQTLSAAAGCQSAGPEPQISNPRGG